MGFSQAAQEIVKQGLTSNLTSTVHTTHVKVGELAKQAGISVSTVRFYEAQGLMPKPRTRESGYREYEQSVLKTPPLDHRRQETALPA
jgi:hypothetical protein